MSVNIWPELYGSWFLNILTYSLCTSGTSYGLNDEYNLYRYETNWFNFINESENFFPTFLAADVSLEAAAASLSALLFLLPALKMKQSSLIDSFQFNERNEKGPNGRT